MRKSRVLAIAAAVVAALVVPAAAHAADALGLAAPVDQLSGAIVAAAYAAIPLAIACAAFGFLRGLDGVAYTGVAVFLMAGLVAFAPTIRDTAFAAGAGGGDIADVVVAPR